MIVAFSRTCLILIGITLLSQREQSAIAQSPPIANPPGFHLLIRLENNKTIYKLGEPIEVEFGCYSDDRNEYHAGCAARADDAVAGITLDVSPLVQRQRLR